MENSNRKTRLGQRPTPAAILSMVLETLSAILSAAFLIASVVVYFISEKYGLMTYSALFYPSAICLTLAITLGVNQSLRGVYPLATVMLIVAFACVALNIAVIVFECVRYGVFYLVPFTFVKL